MEQDWRSCCLVAALVASACARTSSWRGLAVRRQRASHAPSWDAVAQSGAFLAVLGDLIDSVVRAASATCWCSTARRHNRPLPRRLGSVSAPPSGQPALPALLGGADGGRRPRGPRRAAYEPDVVRHSVARSRGVLRRVFELWAVGRATQDRRRLWPSSRGPRGVVRRQHLPEGRKCRLPDGELKLDSRRPRAGGRVIAPWPLSNQHVCGAGPHDAVDQVAKHRQERSRTERTASRMAHVMLAGRRTAALATTTCGRRRSATRAATSSAARSPAPSPGAPRCCSMRAAGRCTPSARPTAALAELAAGVFAEVDFGRMGFFRSSGVLSVLESVSPSG